MHRLEQPAVTTSRATPFDENRSLDYAEPSHKVVKHLKSKSELRQKHFIRTNIVPELSLSQIEDTIVN